MTAQVAQGLNAGDLVISTSTQNMIGVIDGATRKLKWALAGKTGASAQPQAVGGWQHHRPGQQGREARVGWVAHRQDRVRAR